MRRRALLAVGGAEITLFPVTLIEGDNGEIGVKLFEYIIENADDYLAGYDFKDNEGVYVQGTKIQEATIVRDDMIALGSSDLPGNILVVYLFNTGVLTIVYD